MFPQARIELKRRPMVEHQTSIITPRRCPQRSLLPHTHAINLTAMPSNLPHRIPAISRNAVSELFFSVTNSYDALAVAVPG